MTRRALLGMAFAAPSTDAVELPFHIAEDANVQWRQWQRQRFWQQVWPEAQRDLQRGGLKLALTRGEAQVERPRYREPVISGLRAGALNMVVTDTVPLQWENGSAWSGVSLLYRGFALSLIAVNRAHSHELPLVSLNTCVHELMHVLLLDIYEKRRGAVSGPAREFRADVEATRLWLAGDGSGIRPSAREFLRRLEAH